MPFLLVPNIHIQSRLAYALVGVALLMMGWLIPFSNALDRRIVLLAGSSGLFSAASGFCVMCWVSDLFESPAEGRAPRQRNGSEEVAPSAQDGNA
ncbi:MAG TPA: hypothetical protein VLE48_04545 [Terriglobales bacterium]|nr:hypothetical protein [Terriglobales bacterium]